MDGQAYLYYGLDRPRPGGAAQICPQAAEALAPGPPPSTGPIGWLLNGGFLCAQERKNAPSTITGVRLVILVTTTGPGWDRYLQPKAGIT